MIRFAVILLLLGAAAASVESARDPMLVSEGIRGAQVINYSGGSAQPMRSLNGTLGEVPPSCPFKHCPPPGPSGQ